MTMEEVRMSYLIRSKVTGEVYASDGAGSASGPLDGRIVADMTEGDPAEELASAIILGRAHDWAEAPDWVEKREGRILLEWAEV